MLQTLDKIVCMKLSHGAEVQEKLSLKQLEKSAITFSEVVFIAAHYKEEKYSLHTFNLENPKLILEDYFSKETFKNNIDEILRANNKQSIDFFYLEANLGNSGHVAITELAQEFIDEKNKYNNLILFTETEVLLKKLKEPENTKIYNSVITRDAINNLNYELQKKYLQRAEGKDSIDNVQIKQDAVCSKIYEQKENLDNFPGKDKFTFIESENTNLVNSNNESGYIFIDLSQSSKNNNQLTSNLKSIDDSPISKDNAIREVASFDSISKTISSSTSFQKVNEIESAEPPVTVITSSNNSWFGFFCSCFQSNIVEINAAEYTPN